MSKAHTIISQFKSTAPATSTHYHASFSKTIVAKELKDRVDLNGVIIEQRNANLCGPAAFFYNLVKLRPDLYAQAAIDLYTNRQSTLGNLTLKSSVKSRQHNPAQIKSVDWIMMTSIKPNYGTPNDLLEPLKGLTWSGDMKDWLQLAGLSDLDDKTSYSQLRPSRAIRLLLEAQTAYAASYSVFLLVNSNIFVPYRYKQPLNGLPNHWVLLNSYIQIHRYNTTTNSYAPAAIINQTLETSLGTDAKKKKNRAETEADIYEHDEEPIIMKDRITFEAFT